MFSTRTTITRILLDTTLFATPVTTATIPYIKGTFETIARILRTALQHPCISQTHLFTILQQLLENVKDRDEPSHRQGAVYKIECCDYQATYNGETGRNLKIRMTEHKRATTNGDIKNYIAQQQFQTNHRIDWHSAISVLRTVQITINDSLWKAGLLTLSKRHSTLTNHQ